MSWLGNGDIERGERALGEYEKGDRPDTDGVATRGCSTCEL